MNHLKPIKKYTSQGLTVLALLLTSACDEFIQIDPPRTDLVRTTVFTEDATAEATIIDLYYQLRTGGYASGSFVGISFLTSLTSDEQISYYKSTPTTTAEIKQFNDNTLLPNNSQILRIWSEMYKTIYSANVIIEGLQEAPQVSAKLKNQLIGEAKFLRAFTYFYLVNLFGDVPMPTNTDYKTNASLGRSSSQLVYDLIVSDLIDAQTLLVDDFSFSNNERVRPNKGAATALLARTYLYQKEWALAATQASTLINQPSRYALSPSLSTVFNANNAEAIWQFWSTTRPTERSTFRFAASPIFAAINPQFVAEFETGDLRRTTWTNKTGSGFYSTQKYNSTADNPPTQYATAMRLAEMYLIRAEANTHLNNFSEAQTDINVIRQRAGLPPTAASDQTDLLNAVAQERRAEFFNEWGHRWLDLKRTNEATSTLAPGKPQWQTTATLFPLPEYELRNNNALQNSQNPGY